MFLDRTYTPTPLYVVTAHPITSNSAFEAGLRFLAAKDYKNALALFQQAEGLEPSAPDITYYIGEIYRAQGNYHAALDEYQKAIKKDPNFAPAFLGRALANLALNPKADVIQRLNAAISLDPQVYRSVHPARQVSAFKRPICGRSGFQGRRRNRPGFCPGLSLSGGCAVGPG